MRGDKTYDCEAHDERPETGPWMCLGRRPQTLRVFVVLTIVSIGHELRVDQDLGMSLNAASLVGFIAIVRPILCLNGCRRHLE